MQRGSQAAWFVTLGLFAGFIAVFLDEFDIGFGHDDSSDAVLLVAAGTFLLALVLWVLSPSHAQVIGLAFAGLFLGQAVGAWADDFSQEAAGMTVFAIGLAGLALGAAGWLTPKISVGLFFSLLTIAGPYEAGVGDGHIGFEFLAAVAACGVIALGVARASFGIVLAGVGGAFVVLVTFVFEHFSDQIGAPTALMVSGRHSRSRRPPARPLPKRNPQPGGRMRARLYVAGVLGGLGLLVVVAVVVFAVGRSNPSPPSLQNNPRLEIPGEILYVNSDTCFVRAQASGASAELLACVPQFIGGTQLYWPEPGKAAYIRPDVTGATVWTIDLATGATTNTKQVVSPTDGQEYPGLFPGAYAPDGTYAYTDDNGKLFFLVDGVRTLITDFDTNQYSQPQVVLWSPDSQWILLRYYPRRANGPELWIVSRDGSIKGTLIKDASYSGFAWRIGDQVEPQLPK